MWSLPARGVWVEIAGLRREKNVLGSLPARGVWVEIRKEIQDELIRECHSPRGECGLKSSIFKHSAMSTNVTPREGSVG